MRQIVLCLICIILWSFSWSIIPQQSATANMTVEFSLLPPLVLFFLLIFSEEQDVFNGKKQRTFPLEISIPFSLRISSMHFVCSCDSFFLSPAVSCCPTCTTTTTLEDKNKLEANFHLTTSIRGVSSSRDQPPPTTFDARLSTKSNKKCWHTKA